MSINVREGNEVQLVQRLATVLEAEPRVAPLHRVERKPAVRTAARHNRGGPRHTDANALHVRLARLLRDAAHSNRARPRISCGRGRNRGARRRRQRGDRTRALARQDPIGHTIRVALSNQSSEEPAGYWDVTVVGMSGDIISGLIVDGPEPGHVYLPTSPGSRTRARSLREDDRLTT